MFNATVIYFVTKDRLILIMFTTIFPITHFFHYQIDESTAEFTEGKKKNIWKKLTNNTIREKKHNYILKLMWS